MAGGRTEEQAALRPPQLRAPAPATEQRSVTADVLTDLPIELVGVRATGTGADRRHSAWRCRVAGDRIVSATLIEESAHRDVALDAARRWLPKLAISPDPTILVHARPESPTGVGAMPCCSRPFDARRDVITDIATRVTCKGGR
jgi:hypothetical protein